MENDEAGGKEKLIEFICNLTDEECEIIIKALKEEEQSL